MRQAVTIRLGDKSFSIRPLTLDQVERIDGILAERAIGTVAQGHQVIAVGLLRDHPDAARGLSEMEVDVSEVASAMTAILRQGGFLPAEPGEALAAAPNAPTGELSEAG